MNEIRHGGYYTYRPDERHCREGLFFADQDASGEQRRGMSTMTNYETSFEMTDAPADIEQAAEYLSKIPLAPFIGGEPELAPLTLDMQWHLAGSGVEGVITLAAPRLLTRDERERVAAWMQRINVAISSSIQKLSWIKSGLKSSSMQLRLAEARNSSESRQELQADIRDAIDRARGEWHAAGRHESLTEAILREVMQVVPVA